jgi:hypothetical protein
MLAYVVYYEYNADHIVESGSWFEGTGRHSKI